ncbi:MAG: hypothetical protein ABIC40_02350 [bacterium]
MKRIYWIISIFIFVFLSIGANAQEGATAAGEDRTDQSTSANIDGTWVTQSGNTVEITVKGTNVDLYFPEQAKHMTATFDGSILVYTTYYRDVKVEECYVDAPEDDKEACEKFVHNGDPRHRFTLTLSESGRSLDGIKEINVLHCKWKTDENGKNFDFEPAGFTWTYFSDYQWKRIDCDFTGLPPLNGNAIEKYDLIDKLLNDFGVLNPYSFEDFTARDRVRFNYDQAYLDSDTGEFVSAQDASSHRHKTPLDGKVYFDEETGKYMIDLYPYAFGSYVTLLTGLSIMCNQVNACEKADAQLPGPTTQMEMDSVQYAWDNRGFLCAGKNDEFAKHIDYLSRALNYRKRSEK